MPERRHRLRRSSLAWGVCLLAPAALAVLLAVPPLRERLLGPAVPERGPAKVLPERGPQASPPSPGAPGRHRPAASSRAHASATDVSSPPAEAAASPQPREVRSTQPTPTPRSLAGSEASRFLESAYRPYLPPSVGPLRADLRADAIILEAEVDLERLRRELAAPVPELVTRLVGGTTRVQVEGHLVEAGSGVVRLRVEGVAVGAVPLPQVVVEHFLRSEVEARGLQVGDPLLRALYLPEGIESAAVRGDRLLLYPKHGH